MSSWQHIGFHIRGCGGSYRKELIGIGVGKVRDGRIPNFEIDAKYDLYIGGRYYCNISEFKIFESYGRS